MNKNTNDGNFITDGLNQEIPTCTTGARKNPTKIARVSNHKHMLVFVNILVGNRYIFPVCSIFFPTLLNIIIL